jgi:DNA polymerase III epsilon subunit-like protein
MLLDKIEKNESFNLKQHLNEVYETIYNHNKDRNIALDYARLSVVLLGPIVGIKELRPLIKNGFDATAIVLLAESFENETTGLQATADFLGLNKPEPSDLIADLAKKLQTDGYRSFFRTAELTVIIVKDLDLLIESQTKQLDFHEYLKQLEERICQAADQNLPAIRVAVSANICSLNGVQLLLEILKQPRFSVLNESLKNQKKCIDEWLNTSNNVQAIMKLPIEERTLVTAISDMSHSLWKKFTRGYLFFDTETNGKALDFNAPVDDLDNWPRIAQLGWQVYNVSHELISEGSYLIKPDGWEIPQEQFFIDNNMSTERCEEFGIPISEALDKFLVDLTKSKFLIAHNLSFDINVVGAELIRLNKSIPSDITQICTMKASTDFCAIKARWGFKWPTLTELHTKLFNEGFEGAHDALDDVKACARSFFKLEELGIIKTN